MEESVKYHSHAPAGMLAVDAFERGDGAPPSSLALTVCTVLSRNAVFALGRQEAQLAPVA